MFTFHATPYDITASGFYFKDYDDYKKNYDLHLPVEEYEIQFIDGPSDYGQKVLDNFPLEQAIEMLETQEELDIAKVCYVLDMGIQLGNDPTDAVRYAQDNIIIIGNRWPNATMCSEKELVADSVLEEFFPDIANMLEERNLDSYFDTERFIEHSTDGNIEKFNDEWCYVEVMR